MHRLILSSVVVFGAVACGPETRSRTSTSQPSGTPAADGGTAANPTAEATRRIAQRSIGTIEPLHAHGSVYFAGQPSSDDMAKLKEAGIKTIVNLRTAGELTFDEAGRAKELGIGYVHEPIAGAKGMSDEMYGELLAVIGMAMQTLMLTAKAMGYDSCPMIGFDSAKVAKLINLPDDHTIGFMITVGKAIQPAWPKPGQLSLDEVVVTDRFD